MKKRCLIISLIVAMTILMAACGAREAEQKQSGQEQESVSSTAASSTSVDLIRMESERKYERSYTQPEKSVEDQASGSAQNEDVKKNEKPKEQEPKEEPKNQEEGVEKQPANNNQQKRISNGGYNYRFKSAGQEAECRGIAAGIAQMIAAQSDDPWEQIDILARYMNSTYVASITESTEGNYDNPYGVFVEHVGTCAGVTRATGMVLDALGIRWTHANPNQWTHQWNIVEIDGEIGYCDSSMYGRSGKGNLVV